MSAQHIVGAAIAYWLLICLMYWTLSSDSLDDKKLLVKMFRSHRARATVGALMLILAPLAWTVIVVYVIACGFKIAIGHLARRIGVYDT